MFLGTQQKNKSAKLFVKVATILFQLNKYNKNTDIPSTDISNNIQIALKGDPRKKVLQFNAQESNAPVGPCDMRYSQNVNNNMDIYSANQIKSFN